MSRKALLELFRLGGFGLSLGNMHLREAGQEPEDDRDAEDDGAGTLQKDSRPLEHLRDDLMQ